MFSHTQTTDTKAWVQEVTVCYNGRPIYTTVMSLDFTKDEAVREAYREILDELHDDIERLNAYQRLDRLRELHD